MMDDRLDANVGLRENLVEALPRPVPVVPDHEMIRRIGRGSYGEVWLAASAVGTWRAVKVVYRDRFKDDRPYEREFSGIQKYEPVSRANEGLVDVLQIGRNDAEGYFYYVMELADHSGDGTPLGQAEQGGASREMDYVPKTLSAELRRRGRLTMEECITLGLTLNLALGHLHRNGLIHRDVKPSNIIFVNGVAKLADIGLVAELAEAESFVGTEGFIPPEGPNSPQADLYALGKVLYEASMGKDRQEFPEPRSNLGVDPESRALMELNAVLLRACAPEPRQRYQTAQEMNADLALLHSGASVKDKHTLERRLRITTRIAVATVALIVLGIVPYYIAIDRARKAQKEASRSTAIARFLRATLEGAAPSVAAGRDVTLLKEILDRTTVRVRNELANEPEVRLDLEVTLARVYRELGLLEQALQIGRENVAQAVAALGPNHPQIGEARVLLAETLRMLGKLDEAETQVREGLRIIQRVRGVENVDYAIGLRILGSILRLEGKLEEAQKVCTEALNICRRVLGKNNSETADTLIALAEVLEARGKLPEAEALMREALETMKRQQGEENFYVANGLSSLSVILVRQRKLEEAEGLAQEALGLYQKLVGPDHDCVATAAANLAGILMQQGKLNEAESFMRECYTIKQKIFSPDHPDVITSLGNLAVIIGNQGRFAEAEAMHRTELEASRKLYGMKHLAIATLLNNLAGVVRDQGRLEAAESLFHEALTMKRELAGDNDPDVLSILHNYADCLRRRGKLTEAEPLYVEAIALAEKQLGKDTIRVSIIQSHFSVLLLSMNKFQEAESVLRDSLRIKRKLRPGPDLDEAKLLFSLATTLIRQNKWADAEDLSRQALAIRQQKAPGDFDTFASEAQVGVIRLAQTDSSAAEPFLVSGCEGMKKALATLKPTTLDREHFRDGVQSLVRLYRETQRLDKESEWTAVLADVK